MSTKKKVKIETPEERKGSKKKVKHIEINLDQKSYMLKIMNWDNEFKKDMKSGLGFLIDDDVAISKKDFKRTPGGIYSNKYMANDLSDESSFLERYSCNCKENPMRGRFNEGVECPKCKSKVEFKGSDIRKTGWLVLENDNVLINPILYQIIARLIGVKKMTTIVKIEQDIDRNGKIVLQEPDPKNPFKGIGMREFYRRFDEIIEYSYKVSKVKDKDALYDFIKKHRKKVFITKIPIFSLILRPLVMKGNDIILMDINKTYNILVRSVFSLNRTKTKIDSSDLKILPLLYQTQSMLNDVHEQIIDLIGRKSGHIRNNLLGCRINFSSRSVIVPLNGYKINECIMPYLSFLELYKYHIQNLLRKMDGVTASEADKIWNRACLKFDKRVYLIMKHILKNTKGGVKVFINRNPTLNYGSIICLNVADIKCDYEDLTLSISNNILDVLGGDYDGDVVNIIMIPDREMTEAFSLIFDPRHMIIDRNDGKFNRKMNLKKDQMIGIYAFNNM